MKTFISSFTIFTVMLLLIRANGKYLSDVSGELAEIARGIPTYNEIESNDSFDTSREMLTRFKEIWQREQERVSLTVSVRITEGIDDCLDRLFGAIDNGDGCEFDSSRAHLLRILYDLHRYEGVALGALV